MVSQIKQQYAHEETLRAAGDECHVFMSLYSETANAKNQAPYSQTSLFDLSVLVQPLTYSSTI